MLVISNSMVMFAMETRYWGIGCVIVLALREAKVVGPEVRKLGLDAACHGEPVCWREAISTEQHQGGAKRRQIRGLSPYGVRTS